MYTSLLGGQRHNSVQQTLSPMADLPARGTFSYRLKEKVEFFVGHTSVQDSWLYAPRVGYLYWDSVGERTMLNIIDCACAL